MSLETLEARVRDSNVDDAPATQAALNLLHGLQDAGFDSRPIREEISFGIRDESKSTKFISLINMGPNYLHLQEPNKKEDPRAMREFRQRANEIIRFFDVDAIDDVKKFSKQPKYRDVVGHVDELLSFLTAERDRVRLSLAQ